jgi:hypothetical protein
MSILIKSRGFMGEGTRRRALHKDAAVREEIPVTLTWQNGHLIVARSNLSVQGQNAWLQAKQAPRQYSQYNTHSTCTLHISFTAR